jgi:hypothetical protein
MRNISTLVPVAIVGVLMSAMVLAQTSGGEAEVTPAKAPNRAEVIVVATCGGDAFALSHPQGWHDALGAKRVHDRALAIGGNTEFAAACDPTDA